MTDYKLKVICDGGVILETPGSRTRFCCPNKDGGKLLDAIGTLTEGSVITISINDNKATVEASK